VERASWVRAHTTSSFRPRSTSTVACAVPGATPRRCMA
jgi:hypothetical protein